MITVNGKKFMFYEGMSVEDAIKDANEGISDITIILVDNKIIQQTQLDKKIYDKTQIKVLKILAGG